MPNQKPVTPKKRARILAKSGDTVVVKGQTAKNGTRAFYFKGLSAYQQMKKRNSAYQFFTID